MRSVGWLKVASLGVALVVGCGSTTDDSSGSGARSGGGFSGRPITGNGGSSSTTTGNPGAFGNSNVDLGGGSGGASAVLNDNSCGRTDITATRVVPTVMLLLDGSSSMQTMYGDAPDGGMAQQGGPGMMAAPGHSRWDAIRKAIVDPTAGVVMKLQDRVKFGLAVFGTVPSCPLPNGVIMPALNNYATINPAVPQTPPGFTTPTGIALDMIVDMLPDPTSALDQTIGPQIIVLATDGDPNSCGGDPNDPLAAFTIPMTDYAPSIAAAMKLQGKNQKMYVISVGDEAGKMHLQEMANLGAGLPIDQNPGADVYYPENPAALADTLAMLIGQELSCDLGLAGQGVVKESACMGTVELNGKALDCNGADGWELKDAMHITLKGKACDTFKAAADAMLHANFPCEALLD